MTSISKKDHSVKGIDDDFEAAKKKFISDASDGGENKPIAKLLTDFFDLTITTDEQKIAAARDSIGAFHYFSKADPIIIQFLFNRISDGLITLAKKIDTTNANDSNLPPSEMYRVGYRTACNFPALDYPALFQSLIKSLLGTPSLQHGTTGTNSFAFFYHQLLKDAIANTVDLGGFQVNNVKKPEYVTEEHAYTAFWNQLGYDINIILLAMSQRTGSQMLNTSLLNVDLVQLDCYANTEIQRAVEAGLFDKTALADSNGYIMPGKTNKPQKVGRLIEPRPIIITYASKLPVSRIMPYSPIVLLGLPAEFNEPGPSIMSNSRLLTAIKHELGHLVLWRGYVAKLFDIPANYETRDETIKELGTPSRSISHTKGGKVLVHLNRYLRMMQFSQWVTDGIEQIIADVFTAMHSETKACMDFSFHRTKAMILERSFYDKFRYQLPPELRPEIFRYIRGQVAKQQSGGPDSELKDAEKYWWGIGATQGGGISPSYGKDTGENWGWLAELFGNEVGKKHVSPQTVKPYGIDIGLAYEDAKRQLLQVAEIIFQLLGGVSNSVPNPSPSLTGRQLSDYFDVTSMNNYWDELKLKAWASLLVEEERLMRTEYKNSGGIGAYDAYTTDNEELNFYTLLYAGGWIMQSSGNTGSTPP